MQICKVFAVLSIFSCRVMADSPAAQSGNGLMSLLPMLAFVAILYFLLIRPQQKRTKQHQALVSSVKKGDKVVTSSGMIAVVSKVVSDQEVVLEIADGVHCRFYKSSIANIVNPSNEVPTSGGQVGEPQKQISKNESPIGKPAADKKKGAKDAKESIIKKKASVKKDS
jgi:preprotein translocase subunit YajC